MRFAIICSILLIGCSKEEVELPKDEIKYHIGQKLVVSSNDFYNGCIGEAVLLDMWCSTADKKRMQPKYTLTAKCPGVKDTMWMRVAQNNLKLVK